VAAARSGIEQLPPVDVVGSELEVLRAVGIDAVRVRSSRCFDHS